MSNIDKLILEFIENRMILMLDLMKDAAKELYAYAKTKEGQDRYMVEMLASMLATERFSIMLQIKNKYGIDIAKQELTSYWVDEEGNFPPRIVKERERVDER